jgi:hypothetical protein
VSQPFSGGSIFENIGSAFKTNECALTGKNKHKNKLMPKYRIVKDYRNRNTKLSHEKYYIQRKWLWMWNDIDPFDVDSSFYRSGKSWDTFEKALDVYTQIEEIEALKRRGLEVVWPKPRPEWPC